MLCSKLLEPAGDLPGRHVEALGVLEPPPLATRCHGGIRGTALSGGRGADGAGGDADADEALRDAVEFGAHSPVVLDAVEGVLEVEVAEVGVGVVGHDDVLPLVEVRDELVRVVFEAEEVGVGGNVVVRSELVLDAFPGGEVGGVLVAVLPDGAPGGEHGAGGGCGFRIRAIVPIANYNEKDKSFVYQEEGVAVFKLYAVHSGHEPGPLDGNARIMHRVVGHKGGGSSDG